MPQCPDSAATGSNLQQLQRRRKRVLRAGALGGMVLLLLADSAWRTAAPGVHVLLQRCGFLLILVCIVGRTWCTLYIGGYKKRELITKGPYSVVRNPLYVFTIIGVTGVGLLAGSASIALLFGALALVVFAFVTVQEEAFLAGHNVRLPGHPQLDLPVQFPAPQFVPREFDLHQVGGRALPFSYARVRREEDHCSRHAAIWP